MKSLFNRGLATGMLAVFTAATALYGQEFKLGTVKGVEQTVQIHGFGTQGFIHTDDNNWLTMNTSNVGSGEFSDIGLNLGSQTTSKFRWAVQGYDRELGQLGRWHPQFDFFMGDYRAKPWLGFRGGKVKTVLGLYTDTQDMDFDHTFALLPQSMYPIDLRDTSIAHLGGDIYGKAKLPNKYGSLAYTAYGGRRKDSKYSGYPYLLENVAPGVHIYLGGSYGGPVWGGDLRWNTPLKGLVIGASRQNERISGSGTLSVPAAHIAGAPYSEHSFADWTNWFYGKFDKNKWHFASEYKRYYQAKDIFGEEAWFDVDTRGWYASGAYTANKWLEVGSYYSHYRAFFGGADLVPNGPHLAYPSLTEAEKHDYDKVITGKFTINQYFTVKVEGHFMDGNGQATYPDGFYPAVNPTIQDNTNAFVVRAGFSF
ncbi:MAG: hypothetical protein ABSG00_08010 [Terracidiphilus sp.]|jgi:hypothetical protein